MSTGTGYVERGSETPPRQTNSEWASPLLRRVRSVGNGNRRGEFATLRAWGWRTRFSPQGVPCQDLTPRKEASSPLRHVPAATPTPAHNRFLPSALVLTDDFAGGPRCRSYSGRAG